MAIFKRGDQVVLKGKKDHCYWYSVASATRTHVYLKFGRTGLYAGAFLIEDVEYYKEQTEK